jgi:hypothetical protein
MSFSLCDFGLAGDDGRGITRKIERVVLVVSRCRVVGSWLVGVFRLGGSLALPSGGVRLGGSLALPRGEEGDGRGVKD